MEVDSWLAALTLASLFFAVLMYYAARASSSLTRSILDNARKDLSTAINRTLGEYYREEQRLAQIQAKASILLADVAALDVVDPTSRLRSEWFLAMPKDVDTLVQLSRGLGAELEAWSAKVEPPLRWLVDLAERARNNLPSTAEVLTSEERASLARIVHRALDALEGMIDWCQRRQEVLEARHSPAQPTHR